MCSSRINSFTFNWLCKSWKS